MPYSVRAPESTKPALPQPDGKDEIHHIFIVMPAVVRQRQLILEDRWPHTPPPFSRIMIYFNIFLWLSHFTWNRINGPFSHKYLIFYIFLTNGRTPDIKLTLRTAIISYNLNG